MMRSFCKFAPFVVLVLLTATSSEGSLNVQTAKFEDLYNDSLVVTNVTRSGGEGGEVDTNVVRTIAGESVVGFLTETNVSDLASSAQPSSIVSRVSNDSVGFDIEDDKLKLVEDGKVIWELTSNSIDTNVVRSIVSELTPEIVTPMIGAATNGLRRVDDLAVYELEYTAWEVYPSDFEIRLENGAWAPYNGLGLAGNPKGDSKSTNLSWTAGIDGGFDITCTRNVLGVATNGDTIATLNGVNAATNGLARARLPPWLTAESEEPRGKTELRVFEAPYSAWVIEGEHLPDNLTIGRYADYHPEYPVDGFAPVIDGNTVGLVKGNSESVNLSWDDNEWSGGVPLSATRTKLPIGPVSPPQKITRTANLTAGGIAKFGADGVLEKASKSSDVGENADYRDPTDNVCHKTEATEWTFSGEDYNPANTYRVDLVEAEGATRARLYINDVFRVMSPTDGSYAYFGSGFAMEGEQTEVTATRSTVAASNDTFVTWTPMTNAIARLSPIDAANPTFSNAVLAVHISTNDFAALYELKEAFDDMPIDPVTGGISIGALIAALASAAAWLKKNKRGLTDFDEIYTTFPAGDVSPEDFPHITWHLSDTDILKWDEVDTCWHSEQYVFVIQYRGNGRFEFSSSYGSAEWGGYPPDGSMTVETDAGTTFTIRASIPGTRKITRTAKLTAGGLAKFGADGVLEKATEGVDYLKTHQDISGKQDKIMDTGVLKGGGAGVVLPAIPSSSAGELADYRDPLDNTCHKTTSVAGEWSTVTKDGDVWSVHRQDTPDRIDYILQRNGKSYPNSSTKYDGDDTATSLTWVRGVDWDKDFDITFTRTFTTLASKGHTFVTEDVMKANSGHMTDLGEGRYEYVGALEDASTRTYPREEA